MPMKKLPEPRHKFSRLALKNMRLARLRYLAIRFGMREADVVFAPNKSLIEFIMKKQRMRDGAQLELYLVYEDLGEQGDTKIPVKLSGHYSTLEPAVLIYAESPDDAIRLCAKQGTYSITGDSRLVAAKLGPLFAMLVHEDPNPRPCVVDKVDPKYG